jgi:hypothetical protein
MARSRLLRAVHIVGYLTTAIVVSELAGFGYLSWLNWSASQVERARLRELSRTHDRALTANGADIFLEADAAESYQPVRPPPGGPDDALGFVSMPSFSPWSAASIRLPPGAMVALGEFVVVQHNDDTRKLTISQVQTFTVPKADYLKAAQQIDALTDAWPGNGSDLCEDGVPVAFERVRLGHVTSGVGNASCDAHYEAVDRIITPLLSRFGPKLPNSPPPSEPIPLTPTKTLNAN